MEVDKKVFDTIIELGNNIKNIQDLPERVKKIEDNAAINQKSY